MASAVTTQKLGAELYVKSYDHDPGGTSATLASPDGGTTIRYVDMGKYSHLMCVVKPNIAGGDITKVELVASAATTFSSVTVIKDSGTIAADDLDDNVVLECSAEEVIDLGSTLRYVAARLTCDTGTDESTVTYIALPKRAFADQTATSIS